MTSLQQKAFAIVNAIYETIVDAGSHGAPESMLYLALMSHGATHEHFEAIMGALVRSGKITRRNHVAYVK